MGDFERYIDEVKEIASDAGEVAKTVAGDVVSRAKKLTEDGGKVRELTKTAKEQAAAVSFGVSEKVQDLIQDNRAGKELRQGVKELESLPEVEGSIFYTMELGTMINYLKSLMLIIEDKRMDTDSAVEEIKKVITKVQPSAEPVPEDSAEQQAIEKAKAVAFDACIRALDALNT